MGPHKIRQMMKAEREMAQRRFRRQRNKNYLAVPGIHDCILVLDHLKPSYNIGKIFRSAEAFGCREIHLVGIDFFDPAPGMGAFKWVPTVFHDQFFTCYADIVARGYVPYILEPGQGTPVTASALPEKSAFIFGHEEFGISFDPDLFPEIHRLTIPQYGKSQSLNVSVAASIILYEYVRQHGRSPA
ncbi:MAG: TrmH family RNA methyltransferase [Proteobacteria bacterium]|nr:RNA methyltransferase [Desulfobacula sp.]MBU3952823.1 TrmH family RNA methyltransferase [Pseudomonadota bacterium]MBU4131071.1 TrmH family RNA methyltransferase [Pseudomonadota bacterium]